MKQIRNSSLVTFTFYNYKYKIFSFKFRLIFTCEKTIRKVKYGKFEIFKSKNQKNEPTNSTLKLIPKVNVKFSNLRFGTVRSYKNRLK